MKATEHFKQTIKAYLDERAQNDELFAVSYAKENKNLDDCVTFILNQAMAICKEGGCGMTDDEVYSLGVHYYDEDDIEVGKAVNCGVIVNHRVELSPEEQAEARENALKAYQNEELRKIQQRNSKPHRAEKSESRTPDQRYFLITCHEYEIFSARRENGHARVMFFYTAKLRGILTNLPNYKISVANKQNACLKNKIKEEI